MKRGVHPLPRTRGGEGRGEGAAALVLLLVAACGGGTSQPVAQEGGLGRRIAAVEPRAVLPSADGAFLAWLEDCHVARGQFLPPGTANCSLRVAPSAGGDAGKVAGAVTTLPQGVAWGPTGAVLAALADYDYAAGSGALVLWRDGKARELAPDVTFYGFGPAGELGFVSRGALSVLLPGAPEPTAVTGADGIASFDFSRADPAGCAGVGARLLARRARAAGGELLAVGCGLDRARPVAERVGEYGFSADGALAAFTSDAKGGPLLRLAQGPATAPGPVIGRAVQRFAFAQAGRAIAFVGDVAPGTQGNLYVAEPGRGAVRVAKEVGDLRWAAAAPRIAWLESYDPRVRSGAVGAGGPGTRARTFGKNVTDFDLSSDGRYVAFLQHTTRGGYSVDLALAPVEGPAGATAALVAQGVFGFAFSPDAKWLYYRTRCVRNGEGCDLERVPATGLPKDAKPEPIAQGMKSFEFAPHDPGRLLIGWQRADRQALDIAVWQGGKLSRLDQVVLPGSARFLGSDSGRVGYAVVDPKRAGVYVAELPR